MLSLRALLIALLLLGCGGSPADPEPPDGAPPEIDASPYPPPRDDLVPPVGTAGAVDIATWNIENFPQLPTTPSLTADLITSLRLDLIAVEEIADSGAFDELIARLPGHDAVLSSHTYGDGSYQKLGLIYRRDILTVTNPTLLFTNDGYIFPRPPLRVSLTIDDGSHPTVELILIAVHLKAGYDAEDRERRADSIVMLEEYIATVVASGDSEVMVIGDFNEILTSAGGRETMAPFLETEGEYWVHTEELAAAGGESFLPTGQILDHIISSAALDDELAGGDTVIPPLDEQYGSYESAVSDHLPVVVSMPVLE